MKRIANVFISLVIFALIVGGSWAIEYYFYSTEFYKAGSDVRSFFKVLAINDKNKPISPDNITILEPFGSNKDEYISLFTEKHPNYTLAPPPGKYSLNMADRYQQPMDIELESKSTYDGVEVAFDFDTDDYFLFHKYIIKGDKVHPIRSTIVGLGSGFMTLFMVIIAFIVYKIVNRLFGVRQKLLKLILRENTG